jgi:dipeptidyl aminopeptidase/acylaminoacyl peptidase
LNEKDPYWINVSDDLYFLKDGKRFLWSSERSGYRHLYVFDLEGKQLAQITKGEWEVTGLDAVDETKGVAYFTATEKSPLERHLYRAGLDGSGFARVTKEGGTHTVVIAPNGAAFVDTYSNAAAPPRQDLHRTDGLRIAVINENKVAELAEYHLSRLFGPRPRVRNAAALSNGQTGTRRPARRRSLAQIASLCRWQSHWDMGMELRRAHDVARDVRSGR